VAEIVAGGRSQGVVKWCDVAETVAGGRSQRVLKWDGVNKATPVFRGRTMHHSSYFGVPGDSGRGDPERSAEKDWAAVMDVRPVSCRGRHDGRDCRVVSDGR
jgi:hypothetical protein